MSPEALALFDPVWAQGSEITPDLIADGEIDETGSVEADFHRRAA
jgi:hypothetical protein